MYPYSFGREGFPHDMAYASEEHEANGAAAWEGVMEEAPTGEEGEDEDEEVETELAEGEDEDEEAETELAEEEERPENRVPEEALVRQLRFLAGEEPAGLAAGETIATLWARAVARQAERLRRLRLSDDADALPDGPPAPPAHHARHTAFSSPHAAPLTRATIRDFIARNVVGDMEIGAATPSAWAGVPIFPPPELAWRFQCSAPAAGGSCVLDTGFARCALCAWRREAERGEEVLVAEVYVREGGEDFIPLEGGDEIMAEGMAEGEGEE